MSIIRKTMKLIRRMVGAALSDVHTHMPAQVIAYDRDTNLVSVQPCVKVMRTDDPDNITTTQLPVIEDIPVHQFGSGICLLSVAPQEGSYGTLHTTERSIANWIVNGGIVEPGSTRKFDISDAIFEPGLYPMASDGDNGKLQSSIKNDRIELRNRNRDTYISVTDSQVVDIRADGDVHVDSTNGTIELEASSEVKINGSETILQEGTDYAVEYTHLKAAFDQLKEDFNEFVAVTYNLHTHATAPVGPVSVPSLLDITPSTADMRPSKVNDVRVTATIIA